MKMDIDLLSPEEIAEEYVLSQTEQFAKELFGTMEYVKTNLSKYVDFSAMVKDLPRRSVVPEPDFKGLVFDKEFYESFDSEQREYLHEMDEIVEVIHKVWAEFEDMEEKGLDFPPYYDEVIDILEWYAEHYEDAITSYCSKIGISLQDFLGRGEETTFKHLKKLQEEADKADKQLKLQAEAGAHGK